MRCFVALWPSEAARAALAGLTQSVAGLHPGARAMRASNLHLTLAFIGELDPSLAPTLAESLAKILPPEPEVVWSLNHLGHFARAQVVWAGGPPSAELEALAQSSRAALETLGIAYDRRPFAAHVSLLRDARHLDSSAEALAQAFWPIDWPVSAPQLIVSDRRTDGAVQYRPWASMPLSTYP